MNYLAHIYLSGENTDIQIGNFMGDAIKGNKFNNYPLSFKKGILLHRQIDSFTDQHPIVRLSKKRLHSRYGHYKGVLIDIFYDYFLAKNWTNYSDVAFEKYIADFYKVLLQNQEVLPPRIQMMTPHLVSKNWFAKYDNLNGIERVLIGMAKRIKHDIPLERGIDDLKDHYTDFEADFSKFFPLIQEHAKKELEYLHKLYQ